MLGYMPPSKVDAVRRDIEVAEDVICQIDLLVECQDMEGIDGRSQGGVFWSPPGFESIHTKGHSFLAKKPLCKLSYPA